MAANPKGSFENIKQIDIIIPQVQNSQLKYNYNSSIKCMSLRCRVIHIRGSLLKIILFHVNSTCWISDLIWGFGSKKLNMYLDRAIHFIIMMMIIIIIIIINNNSNSLGFTPSILLVFDSLHSCLKYILLFKRVIDKLIEQYFS